MGAVEGFDFVQGIGLPVHAELFERELHEVAHGARRVGGEGGFLAQGDCGSVLPARGGLTRQHERRVRAVDFVGPAFAGHETDPYRGAVQPVVEILFQSLGQRFVGLLIGEVATPVGGGNLPAAPAPVEFANPADVAALRRHDCRRGLRHGHGFRSLQNGEAADFLRAFGSGEVAGQGIEGAFGVLQADRLREGLACDQRGQYASQTLLEAKPEALVEQADGGNVLRVQGADRQDTEQVFFGGAFGATGVGFEDSQRGVGAGLGPSPLAEGAQRGLVETAPDEKHVGVVQARAGQHGPAETGRVGAPRVLTGGLRLGNELAGGPRRRRHPLAVGTLHAVLKFTVNTVKFFPFLAGELSEQVADFSVAERKPRHGHFVSE